MKVHKALAALAAIILASACAENPFWKDTLDKYASDPEVRSLLLIRQTGLNTADAEFLVKSDSGWKKIDVCEALIGKNGTGKTREGDGRTPVGDFDVTGAFGILPDPGSVFPYTAVTTSTFACDEEGPWYNQIIDTVATAHACKGEDMFHTDPEYAYGLTIDFNPDCIYPLGSAVFVHCKGAKAWTGGCVALDRDFLLTVLKCASGRTVVCIRGDN